MVSLVKYFLNFYSLKLTILTKTSLIEKVSIFVDFNILNSLYSILSLEPTDGVLKSNTGSLFGECKMLMQFW